MTLPVRVLLLSTYELGRQPFGLASPAAWLRRAGAQVRCRDLSRDRLDVDEVRSATLVAIYLPMHTATRLAMPLIDRIRLLNPAAHVCGFGLYAPLNEAGLRARGVGTVLGAEFEGDLVALAETLSNGGLTHTEAEASAHSDHTSTRKDHASAVSVGRSFSFGIRVPRLAFITPDRTGLPPLTRYAALQHGADRIVAGYTEASRGCRHMCRHCPIVPIYQGQFRVVPVEVVMEDIRAQVQQGARHITFGDPDFFNGIGHARRIVDAFHREWPGLTYDVTIKIEHLLRHRDALARLVETGCLFVTSAVESVDDNVLSLLAKGHTRADFIEAVGLCRDAGLALAPTFVPFTPWTTIEDYAELLETIEALDLVEHVAPVQLAIRLLVTSGSLLLQLPDIQRVISSFDADALTYPWTHPDRRVDELQEHVMSLVGRSEAPASRPELFEQIANLAGTFVASPRRTCVTNLRQNPRRNRVTIPYLTEPWYC